MDLEGRRAGDAVCEGGSFRLSRVTFSQIKRRNGIDKKGLATGGCS